MKKKKKSKYMKINLIYLFNENKLGKNHLFHGQLLEMLC